ncbi:MAG: ATP-binding cassette domain-containing protein [Gammaproteobacteria bacterium]|nr:ATP-binding cassette domain-containing protein [Gammaproteobacteria bacterium]
MLQVIDISLKRASQQIFEQLTCTVHPGHKVGVVGRNGAGKSTLFELILGRLQPDDGDVVVPSGWQITHMAQQFRVTDRPALEYVIDGHRALRKIEVELAKAETDGDDLALANLHTRYADVGGHEAESRAGEILHGLGFYGSDFARPFEDFSGGMRIRLNLAKALMAPTDLLLLDEPTNHLDLETTMWLESWLIRYPGTLLIIAHDRVFLDGVCDHIVHLNDARADVYRGNYSAFERQRAETLANRESAYSRQQVQIRHMRSFVDRFRAKASKARQAQSRLKALERMQAVAPVHAESPYRFSFTNPDQMSYPLLSLEDVSIGYGSTAILSGINASLLPGARIGILGANGAGKSTLLKCLVGTLAPQSGELIRGRHAKVGYFAQHQLESLDASASALTTLSKAKTGAREQWCRDYLGGWGFVADMVMRPIATLSGGEKARLVLALIALEKPAILVLDEPTNHLDLEMREALAIALQDYTGALLLVSHDRSLLGRSVDEFWLVEAGKVKPLSGDLDAYAQSRQAPAPATRPQSTRKAQRQAAAMQRQVEKPLRDTVVSLEAELEQLAAALKATEARLADPDIYHNLPAAELDQLLVESGRLRKKIAAAEHSWLTASEALEKLIR